jgi:hypothetical protein
VPLETPRIRQQQGIFVREKEYRDVYTRATLCIAATTDGSSHHATGSFGCHGAALAVNNVARTLGEILLSSSFGTHQSTEFTHAHVRMNRYRATEHHDSRQNPLFAIAATERAPFHVIRILPLDPCRHCFGASLESGLTLMVPSLDTESRPLWIWDLRVRQSGGLF